MSNQPAYTDCDNCGACDHAGYSCPCGCHDNGDAHAGRARAVAAVPWVEVDRETAYGSMVRISRAVRVF